MKKNLHLIATVDRPEILEKIIKELANRRDHSRYGYAAVPTSWQALDTTSVESYMSGRVEFDYNASQRIRIPYITCFMFSCTKEINGRYDLCWSNSLS